MICPHCLRTVPDGVEFCPSCHAYLGVARSVSHDEFVYCEGCGARLSPHDRTCPKCGRPAPGILSTHSSSSDLAAGKTASFPRLTQRMIEQKGIAHEQAGNASRVAVDSVDPAVTNVLHPRDIAALEAEGKSGEDPYHKPRRRFVRPLVTVAVLAALGGGGYYFVTRDPLQVMPGVYAWFKQSASEMYPSRQGAEGSAEPAAEDQAAEDRVLSDQEAYQKLSACYQRIVQAHDQIDGIVSNYNAAYLASDRSKRVTASGSAYAARDTIDAVLTDLSDIKLADGSPYAEEVANLTQLAQWVRTRVDMYCASWDISLSYEGSDLPSRHQAEIIKPLRDRAQADADARTAYYKNVEGYRPVQPAS